MWQGGVARRCGKEVRHLLVCEAGGDEVGDLGHVVAHRREEGLEWRGQPEGVAHEPAQVLLSLAQEAEARAARMQEGHVVRRAVGDDLVGARDDDMVLAGGARAARRLLLQRVRELDAYERLTIEGGDHVAGAQLPLLGGHAARLDGHDDVVLAHDEAEAVLVAAHAHLELLRALRRRHLAVLHEW